MENQHRKVWIPKSSLTQFSDLWTSFSPSYAKPGHTPIHHCHPAGHPQLLAQPVPGDRGSKPFTQQNTLLSVLPLSHRFLQPKI